MDGFIRGHTGATTWTSEDLAGQLSAALTFAEGLLYIVSDVGEVGLVRPDPERIDIISRFAVPEGGKGGLHAFPVVCGGRL